MNWTCRFCGCVGRMTKEHVWPRWLADYLPRPKKLGHAQLWSSTSGGTGWQAPILSTEVREACATCNNGWMGDIEAAAKPIVGPMVTGQAVEVDAEAQAVIANWVAVKDSWPP